LEVKGEDMEFQVVERMMLLNLLSTAEGDVTALRVVRETQNKLGFSDEEREALNFQQDANQVRWNAEADQAVEVDIGKAAHKLIAEKLLALSVQKKLTLNQLTLYERFVEEEEKDD